MRSEMHSGHYQAWDPHVDLALKWFDLLATDAAH